LHVVGIKDESNHEPANVINHGFLKKSNPLELNKLQDLFKQSHIFIMPSREEASALVYNEANSFALPVIASNVGGTSSIITNSVNGFLVNIDNAIKELAEKIEMLIQDKNLYKNMSINAFHEFKSRLNWDSAGAKVSSIINNVVK
jgi:glycosyltransferase involved in cell wall biosynthesis